MPVGLHSINVCRASKNSLYSKVTARLRFLTSRSRLRALPKPQFRPREALEYVYQGTIQPKGMLTHGLLRGSGKKIEDASSFAAAIKKSEIQEMASVTVLRQKHDGVFVMESPQKTEQEPEISADTEDDDIVAQVTEQSAEAVVEKRGRSAMQGDITTSPLRPLPIPHVSIASHPTIEVDDSDSDSLLWNALQRAYKDHPLIISKQYSTFKDINCSPEVAASIIDVS